MQYEMFIEYLFKFFQDIGSIKEVLLFNMTQKKPDMKIFF